MGYDYDKLYGETSDALGPPTAQVVEFFDHLPDPSVRVLDVGCGQGRDALFIARRGHSVLGVDISSNGIRDLTNAAQAEALPITGLVADITRFRPDGFFDVILCDRTLHMLDRDARLSVMTRLLEHVAPHGWLLVVDEPSNMSDFLRVIDRDAHAWREGLRKRGYLFVQRS